MTRDVGRRIKGNDVLQEVFAKPMSLARRVRDQDPTSAARRSIPCMPRKWSASARAKRTALRVRRQGQGRDPPQAFKRRPVCRPCGGVAGNPYDGHTLGAVIPAMEQMIGDTIERALTDTGYRGTMRRPVTGSRSTPPARSVALHRRSNASSSGVLRSSP